MKIKTRMRRKDKLFYDGLETIDRLTDLSRREQNLRGQLYCAGFSDIEVEMEIKKAHETDDWS